MKLMTLTIEYPDREEATIVDFIFKALKGYKIFIHEINKEVN